MAAAPDDDAWYQGEQRMRRALVAELQRLKRRARARWPLILVISLALTGAALYRQASKVRVHEAEVTLAVTEGSLSNGRQPLPIHELRDYINGVLLADSVLLALIEEWDLFPLRAKLGDDYALGEMRDLFEVGVYRNFFVEQFDIDEPRSARISIEVNHPDPDLAWRIARRLATVVIAGEQARRLALADTLASDAAAALTRAHARVSELEAAVASLGVAMAQADTDGAPGRAAALGVEMSSLSARLARESSAVHTLGQLANRDEQAAAIDRAGLGTRFAITEERKPLDEPGTRLYLQIILGTLLFFVVLPTVAIFIGTFDSRVHDREDVERLGLPVVGHLPPFPGDRVGSLRARGVRGRRVPS